MILKMVVTIMLNSGPQNCPTSEIHQKCEIMKYKKSSVQEFIEKTLTLRGSEN
jgi:hypothetical protein